MSWFKLPSGAYINFTDGLIVGGAPSGELVTILSMHAGMDTSKKIDGPDARAILNHIDRNAEVLNSDPIKGDAP